VGEPAALESDKKCGTLFCRQQVQNALAQDSNRKESLESCRDAVGATELEIESLLMKPRLLTIVFGLVLSCMAAQAHHSISGAYITSKEITVEGIVREFHFVNPHPFLVVEVRNANGMVQTWRLEMDNRSELSEVGMKNSTFKSGDRIVASGNPAATQKESLYIRKLERASDGFQYEQIGSSPVIKSKPR